MDSLYPSAETALWGLFASSFLSATLLPGSSEAVLFALIRYYPAETNLALLLATLGNTAGGMTTWACGRWLPAWRKASALPQLQTVQRKGAVMLLFSWVPLIGDALCIAAGWLRLHWLPCCLFMLVGKAARYWLVAQGAGLIPP